MGYTAGAAGYNNGGSAESIPRNTGTSGGRGSEIPLHIGKGLPGTCNRNFKL